MRPVAAQAIRPVLTTKEAALGELPTSTGYCTGIKAEGPSPGTCPDVLAQALGALV